WLETNNLFNNLIQRNQSAAFSSGKVRPNHETNINIIARRTGKDVNSHTVLDGIITTIMATIQRINIIGWLNMLGTFVKDWFRYESHFVHGRDSLVDILKERGLLSESDAVQPLIGKKS